MEAQDALAVISSLENPSYEKSQGENFVCPLCSKSFGYRNGLIRHLRITHVKEKPFQCNVCQRRFGYKNILLEHQNIHFGIKPYACTQCEKRFAARSNLIQHRMTHRKPYSCHLCYKKYDREDQLERHLLAHPRGMLLTCNSCGFSCAGQEELSDHVVQNHPPQVLDTRWKPKISMEGVMSMSPHGTVALPSIDTFQYCGGEVVSNTTGVPFVDVHAGDGKKHIDDLCSHLASRGSTGFDPTVRVKQEKVSPGGMPLPSQYKGELDLPSCAELPSHSTGSNFTFPQLDGNTLSSDLNTEPLHHINEPASQSCFPESHSDVSVSPAPSISISPARHHSAHHTITGFGGAARHSPASRTSNSPGHSTDCNIPADSTTNMTEIISSLQSWLQRSQDGSPSMPQISINVGPKPNLRPAAASGAHELDEVLAYYIAQGTLFECRHCGIIFRERGTYFMHSSLHGNINPWQCSICRTTCKDKNDFSLHFINQPHQASHH